jgi:hypothetical protein
VIRLVVMMYIRYPLSLRNVEDLLFERGIDICHETVRLWWNRFGADVRRRNPQAARPELAGQSHNSPVARISTPCRPKNGVSAVLISSGF